MSGMIRSITLVAIMSVSMLACAEGPKYRRAECIVRVNINWDVADSDKRKVIKDIFDTYPQAPKMELDRKSVV